MVEGYLKVILNVTFWVEILIYLWTCPFAVILDPNMPVFSYVHLTLNISENAHRFFSETLHEVRGPWSKKSDTDGIFKKNLNPGIKGIKCQKSGFLYIFSETGF